MKVFIVGGAGVFGSRLAERLIRCGHTVAIASRTKQSGKAAAERLGCQWFCFDEAHPDRAVISAVQPDILIDAAGPFQTYGLESYRLARMAIECGIHYLDFSDDAAFSSGIDALNDDAKKAGVAVISGVSTVPALSAAIAADLTADLSEVTLLESALLPGNKAPRGRAVMAAILAQVGEPMRQWRGNRWEQAIGWTDQKTYILPGGERRKAAFIGAPDLHLFPKRFGARSVLFRAGLELTLFQQSMRALGWLRQRRLLPKLDHFTGLFHWMAGWFEPFGSDVGGMVVCVQGRGDAGGVQRTWHVLAEAGDGPYIPALPAAALVERWQQTAPVPGARACIAELSRQDIEGQLQTLQTQTYVEEKPHTPLFENKFSEQWSALPGEVQRLHDLWDMERFEGRARVERGSGIIATIIAALFRFPKTARDIEVCVTMQRIGQRELWVREFGDSRFKSILTFEPNGAVFERFGPLNAELDLRVESRSLVFPVKRAWLFGIQLPRWLTPISDAREFEKNGRFEFDVRIALPGIGLLNRYQGWLKPADTP